jgi:hypothetical protein
MAQLSRDALDDRIARLDKLTNGLRTEVANLHHGAPPLTGEELRACLDGLRDAATALGEPGRPWLRPTCDLLGPNYVKNARLSRATASAWNDLCSLDIGKKESTIGHNNF